MANHEEVVGADVDDNSSLDAGTRVEAIEGAREESLKGGATVLRRQSEGANPVADRAADASRGVRKVYYRGPHRE